ncbi:Ankyrin Repeat [Musa troglodytarum]|uniref:Ankyrin Repeat n=1 Tax=Musa troglodytarum TaxID=320322 RepID=A0A9E7FG43_9LILI|nr:Ankyrin Repeat [Musa troglodytarum]
MAGMDPSKYAHSPAHKAVLARDYASLKRVLAALPRLADPSSIRTEAASFAEEEKAEAISAVVDRRDVPNRETPLHLAVRLGDAAAVGMLMTAGADYSLQNERGWSALQEAICAREENLAKIIVRHYQQLAWAKWCRRLPQVVATMRRMRDFYMEITFHFESSVIPFISRIAPSDTCKIWKRGSNLRADMTLAGFDGFRIQRSDQSILFLGDGSEDGKVPPGSLCVISHKDKEVMNALDGAGTPPTEAEVQQEVAAMSQTNIFRPGIDVTQAVLLPQLTWRRQERTEMVGPWKAKVYEMHHVVVSVKSRQVPGAMTDEEFFSACDDNDTESEEFEDVLTEEERKQLERALQMKSPDMLDSDACAARRHSCYEPREMAVEDVCGSSSSRNSENRQDRRSWFGNWGKRGSNHKQDGQRKAVPPSVVLVDSPPGHQSRPGRRSIEVVKRPATSKESEYRKGLRPILWLSPDFPLQTEELLPLLDILANKVKAIRRLRDLLTTKLPPGTFPVKQVRGATALGRVLDTSFKPWERDPRNTGIKLLDSMDKGALSSRLCHLSRAWQPCGGHTRSVWDST